VIHGQERNRRTETDTQFADFHTPQGTVTLPAVSHTRTVSEKWCDVCGCWVTSKGIIGALLCTECGTPWKPEYRQVQQ